MAVPKKRRSSSKRDIRRKSWKSVGFSTLEKRFTKTDLKQKIDLTKKRSFPVNDMPEDISMPKKKKRRPLRLQNLKKALQKEFPKRTKKSQKRAISMPKEKKRRPLRLQNLEKALQKELQ